MKAMLCMRCWDLVKFQYPEHYIWCECKRTMGFLHDHVNISVWGPSVVMGINNLSLKYALQIEEIDPRSGVPVHAFIISEDADSITRETHDSQRKFYDEAQHRKYSPRFGIGESVY